MSKVGCILFGDFLMLKLFYLMVLLNLCFGCASIRPGSAPDDHKKLQKFALASCLLDYFEYKGFDTYDIGAIAGGIVETSDLPLEQFHQTALDVRSYSPDLKTKQNIDIRLLKCFYLENFPPNSSHVND